MGHDGHQGHQPPQSFDLARFVFEHPAGPRHQKAKEATAVIAVLLTVTSFFLSTQVSWSVPHPPLVLDQLVAPAAILSFVSLFLAVVVDREHRRTRPVEICVYRHGVRFGDLELAHDEPLDVLSTGLLALELQGFRGNPMALHACLDTVRQRAQFTDTDAPLDEQLQRLRRR